VLRSPGCRKRASPIQMKIAAIYVPVSAPGQNQDVMMAALRRLALHKNWRVREYCERHARARIRPVYNRMLRDADRHRFDVVLVQSLDCFAQSLAGLSVRVTSLHQLGIRFVAVNEGIDIAPETTESRTFLSTLDTLVNAAKNMIGRNVREGVTRAQGKGVHCGRPRHSFPIARVLKLRTQGLSIRAVAERIGFPASTVGAALKARSKDGDVAGPSVPASTAKKRAKGVRGMRTRRTFPLDEAGQLREQGLSIRSVAARIRFPPSTVGAALKAHSLAQARKLAGRLEREARGTIKREQN
jgi:DNA invertase Pin-like site-specific DNA recombinase